MIFNNTLQELNGQSQTTVFSSQASANPCFVQCLLTCFKTSGKPIKRISYNVIGWKKSLFFSIEQFVGGWPTVYFRGYDRCELAVSYQCYLTSSQTTAKMHDPLPYSHIWPYRICVCVNSRPMNDQTVYI